MKPSDDETDRKYVLRLRNVGVTYSGGVVALRSTTLDFFQREFSVLLGLSGAGKSTLLRSLNLLVKPTSGEIVSSDFGVLGPTGALRQHRRRTALIFQHHQLIERHTALANVLTGRLGYHNTLRSFFPLPRADLELALHCLERVGLADKSMTRVDQLSGGQKQRVGIARALAQQRASRWEYAKQRQGRTGGERRHVVLLGAMAGLGSPWIGAVLLLAFGRGRGLPVALGAMSIGWLENLHRLAPYRRIFETAGGVTLMAAGLYMLNAYFFWIPASATCFDRSC